MGGVEFLRDDFGETHSETETEFMGIVYESARRLAGFMNDAIMMASLQARNAQSGFEPFSLHTIVQSKIDSLKDALERDELRLTAHDERRVAPVLIGQTCGAREQQDRDR